MNLFDNIDQVRTIIECVNGDDHKNDLRKAIDVVEKSALLVVPYADLPHKQKLRDQINYIQNELDNCHDAYVEHAVLQDILQTLKGAYNVNYS